MEHSVESLRRKLTVCVTLLLVAMETSKPLLFQKVRVVIYSRPGCHLCQEAKQVIQASGFEEEYTLEEINIESDPDLLRRYRYDIPVITINGVEVFRHRLTSDEFRKRLGETAARRGPYG